MIRRSIIALVLAAVNLPQLAAQQPQTPTIPPQKPVTSQMPNPPEIDSQDVVKITTNLVQVDAVVTKDGKQVTDLQPDEFEIFEDGKPQLITNFSYISNVSAPAAGAPVIARPKPADKTAPPIPAAVARPQDARRTIALVIDDLGMSFQSISDARKQARKFVTEQLQPNDMVAIIHTSGEVGSLQQFTTNRSMLYSAIDRLRWYPCSRAGAYVFNPVGTPPPAPGDAPCGGSRNIRDTLRALKFIVEGMRELPGRKSLVLMSDHLPIETQEPGTVTLTPGDGDLADVRTNYTAQLHKVAELAIRASVVIYASDTRGLPYTGMTAADSAHPFLAPTATAREITNTINSTLSSRSMAMVANREGSELIAKQTGGFLVRNSNDFGLKRIAEDQNGYYLLAYRPSEQTFNRQFHHLKVTVKRKGLSVRTRDGFLGVGNLEAPQPLSTTGLLNKTLMSPFGANEITVRLTTIFTNFESGSLLRSLLYIDPRDFAFVDETGGGHVAAFDLGIVLFGDNGRVMDQQSRQVTLRLSKDTFENALRGGLVYTVDTPLKTAGALQFRIALRDQASARLGSAGQFIQIPNLADGRLALSGLVLLKDIPDKPGDANATPQDARDAISSGPAVRQFRAGDKVIFAYSIYNARPDVTTQVPQLTTQMRIFHDGKPIFSGPAAAIDTAAQTDLKRIAGVGRLRIGNEFAPGDYVLQVIISDQSAKEKPQVASQWIDFEIVK